MSRPGSEVLRRGVGELVVIVLGVLIALGVDSWREELTLRSMEREYLISLEDDLRRDLEEYARASRLAERNEGAAWVVLAQLAEPEIGGDSLAGAVTRAGYLYVPALSRVTFEELKSTGNLKLLRDVELRRGIAEYYQLFDQRMQWVGGYQAVREEYGRSIRGILGPEVARRFPVGIPLELTPEDRDNIILGLRSRPEIPGLLEEMIRIQVRTRREQDALEDAVEELLRRFEAREGAP